MATAKVQPVEPTKAKKTRLRRKRERYTLPEGIEKLEVATHEDFELPPRYSAKKHGPLRPVHFADRASYHEYKAWKALKEFDEAKKDAALWREKGPQMQMQTKVSRMRKQLETMREQLVAAGADTAQLDALLAAANAATDES